jgi:hypothetical protein
MLSKVAPLLSILVACAGDTYKKSLPAVPPLQRTGAPYELSASAREAQLTAVIFDLPIGYAMGETASGYYGSCNRKRPMVNAAGRFELESKKYTDVFNAVMKKRGYAVEEQVELFKNSKERVADLKVGARVVDAALNECYPNLAENSLKASGSAYLKIEWSVYSMRWRSRALPASRVRRDGSPRSPRAPLAALRPVWQR